ncbi:LOW QUALITY PROTEIN: protein dispatched homolog 2 [Cottoperca gobio]|uniref:LOW QUALITY PROTEIN: protein dispatched homolog 2 n=1 Tax=Cottoperca gobio TaxID=56716 RepID=A0A6J2S2D2_COTGO|nr:LOW QUALITY PROTEIN: protein dispatched homolog 2 [Cottoperca gobio]
MEACSTIGESTDAIVMDSPTDEMGIQEACQSSIPAVSLCPPDSECSAEAQLTVDQSEGELCDSCSSLGRPSSSCQLYHQVPQPGVYDSPRTRKCPHCSHYGPVKPNTCRDCHSNATCHAEGGVMGKVGHSRSSAHQTSNHSAVRCHWLHGSNESGTKKPTQRHVVTVRDGGLYLILRNYSQVLVDYPLAVLVGCAVLLLGCSLAGLFIGPLPDFSDPLLGFEPRGTYIGVRQSSLSKLQENTGPGKRLSPLPQQLSKSFGGVVSGSQDASRLRIKRMLARDSSPDTFLCDAPGERLAQLVFRSENSASLWSLKAIHAMCEMEQSRIRSQAQFQGLCQQHVRGEAEGASRGGCCPSWSLGNYLAVLTNASCCLSLTSHQVSESLNLLRKCAPYYHEGHLVEACVERPKHGGCSSVPSRCKQSRVVFQILHFLVDKDFVGPQTVEYQIPTLKYSLLFLPVDKGEHMMEIYMNSLEGRDLTYNNTTITGMDFGIKQRLFKYYLARDAIYPVLAVASLLFTMALYLHSLFIVALSVIAITGSLLTSYFFYKVAFRLTFFPLVNLSAALILLGSCSNQVFIFTDFWNLQLSQNPSASLEKRVNRALQEVGYLILASGLTSSAAFFSGYLSSITAIRCFSVYLGTASFISSFLPLVWLPCSFILRERYTEASSASVAVQGWKPCCSKNNGGFWDTSSRKRCIFTLRQKLKELKRGLSDTSNLLFLKILPCGVVKFRYIWVCWFAVLAAGGTYMSCIDPGMNLPTLDSRVAKLFRSSHPFERYDAEYCHMFMFERQKNGEDKPVTLMLVWGVKPTDNGDHFNPKSNGSLVLDQDFNMSRPDAQVWLRDLCGRVQNQSFYSPPSTEDEDAMTENICLVEQLIQWVSVRRCSESDDSLHFCCNDIPFPYTPSVFENCLSMMLAEKYAEGHLAHSEGLYFQPDGRIAALVLAFKTTYLYSFNFSRTSLFYKEILTWFNNEISGAPQGLENGWFISHLSLFDLQQALSSETLVVAGFSVALTFALLLLTTWNIPLSIYGTVAVGGSVFVTISLLVLLEWQLSGIEALFISAAAGLSVDFVANYCISYTLAPHSDKIGKVAHSTKRMGCPVAIVSGAFFSMGIIMLPATVLLFRKLGIFLFLVKCVACGFATFFLQSLCCFFGPEKNCGKITLPCVSDHNDGVLSSCSAADPGSSSASAANGSFGRSRVRRSYDKEAGGYLYPDHQRQQRQKQAGAGGGGGRGPEQYELQPLAYRLSDSFENSTCTSKLSNRPSVLSDEIEYCGGDVGRNSTDGDSEEICSHQNKPPPALQTSSPYKENTLRPVGLAQEDAAKDKLLCKTCRGQSCGVKHWSNTSFSSTSSMEDAIISHTLETIDQPSLCKDDQTTEESLHPHHHSNKGNLSSRSQSSCEGLEDSNETCLSDIEAGPSNTQQNEAEEEGQLQPGHLNGKRDTLRLSLKDTVYETGNKGRSSQSEEVVILPNSKPDLPDVWIKRDGQREDTC